MYQIWFKLALWLWNSFESLNVVFLSSCRYYLPLEKGVTLNLNILKSLFIKDVLVQFKIGSVALERKIFTSCISLYIPLANRVAFTLNNLNSPAGYFVLSLIEMGPWFWRKKNLKSPQ